MKPRLKWNERLHAYGYETRDAALAAAPKGARVVPYVLAGNRQRWAIAVRDRTLELV